MPLRIAAGVDPADALRRRRPAHFPDYERRRGDIASAKNCFFATASAEHDFIAAQIGSLFDARLRLNQKTTWSFDGAYGVVAASSRLGWRRSCGVLILEDPGFFGSIGLQRVMAIEMIRSKIQEKQLMSRTEPVDEFELKLLSSRRYSVIASGFDGSYQRRADVAGEDGGRIQLAARCVRPAKWSWSSHRTGDADYRPLQKAISQLDFAPNREIHRLSGHSSGASARHRGSESQDLCAPQNASSCAPNESATPNITQPCDGVANLGFMIACPLHGPLRAR